MGGKESNQTKQISGHMDRVKVSLFEEQSILSYDVASGSEIKPYNKIDKPLVVYRFSGNAIASITTLRT